MVLKLKSKQGTATTTKTDSQQGKPVAENTTTELVGEAIMMEAPAIVGVEASYTKNLGDYNSCRIAVRLDMPCPKEEVDETYVSVKEWVDERLSNAIAELDAEE